MFHVKQWKKPGLLDSGELRLFQQEMNKGML